MLAIMSAMKEEISGLLGLMTVERRSIVNGSRLFQGWYREREVLVAQTGPGRARTEGASAFVLEQFPVDVVVSAGFGGALADGLKAGDLVLCGTIFCGSQQHDWAPRQSDERLVDTARRSLEGQGEIRLLTGHCATTDGLVSSPEEKQALRAELEAEVVDMESYWVAQAAADRRIPFLSVRAISDQSNESLPAFDRILGPAGEWQWDRAARHLASHRGDLVRLARIALNARLAATNLTSFLGSFIPLVEVEIR